jgi:hypothetical protein
VVTRLYDNRRCFLCGPCHGYINEVPIVEESVESSVQEISVERDSSESRNSFAREFRRQFDS